MIAIQKKRLSQILRELNDNDLPDVSLGSAKEHLKSKGKDAAALELSSKPPLEYYEILLKEFRPDKFEKYIAQKNTKPSQEIPKAKKEPAPSEVIKAKAPTNKGEIKIIKSAPKEETKIPEKKESKPIPPAKKTIAKKIEISQDIKEVTPKEVIVLEKNKEPQPKDSEFQTKSAHIKTKYKKLEGPKLVDKTVDLKKFEKPKKQKNKRTSGQPKRIKRKRIVKPSPNSQRIKHKKTKRRSLVFKTDEPSEEDIRRQVKETLERLQNNSKKSASAKLRKEKKVLRKKQVQEQLESQEAENKILKITEFVTASELATMMDEPVTKIISACMSLGMMVTMNQRLDSDTLTIVAEEFGFQVEFVDSELGEIAEDTTQEDQEDLEPRPPIVTVMGHVDHGKTSLLDYIRSTNVTGEESGSITQHIGAYSVSLKNGQRITFLDTPGHHAFTAMRARGARITDIAIIVIAADDQIMPQTKEAISHARAAGVPIVFAINKIDAPAANPDKIKEQLAGMDLLVEDWGGKIQSHDISAKKGLGIMELLEKVLLEAELLELKANPNRIASGTVVEASLDKGRGYVSTLLVQNGTLKKGDYILVGRFSGKVRAMFDENAKPLKQAGPSVPVSVLGLGGAPNAGDRFNVYQDEREAKQIANKRSQFQREQSVKTQKHITLDEIGRRIAVGDFKELNLIIKGDVDGSVEALVGALQKLSTQEIQIKIIHKGVGTITESDVLLAATSNSIIIGFNVKSSGNAKTIAEREQVDIRSYTVIFSAIDDLKNAMEGMLSLDIKEEIIGNVEIREVFKISKLGSIAGCMVTQGKILRNSKVRLIRDGVVLHTGELESLKRFKDDVKEVTKGYDCGLQIKDYNAIESGDTIDVYKEVAVKKKL